MTFASSYVGGQLGSWVAAVTPHHLQGDCCHQRGTLTATRASVFRVCSLTGLLWAPLNCPLLRFGPGTSPARSCSAEGMLPLRPCFCREPQLGEVQLQRMCLSLWRLVWSARAACLDGAVSLSIALPGRSGVSCLLGGRERSRGKANTKGLSADRGLVENQAIESRYLEQQLLLFLSLNHLPKLLVLCPVSSQLGRL